MPILHHQKIATAGAPEPTRWILVLHGIYGAGRNWASVARRFVQARPEWGAVLVDLRQHGGSTGFPPPHTVQACADDLAALVKGEGLEARAILGHSFGGKVAMVYARHAPVPLERVWVVDSTPEARAPDGSAWGMLRVLRLYPGPFPDRGAGIAAVESEGFPNSVAQWMSTNLVHEDDGYRWRLDANEMESLMRSFFATDTWDVVEDPPAGAQMHLIRAEESSVLSDGACARTEAAGRANGRTHLHRVAGGHWVNADNPDALQELLTAYM
ncbi:MAG: alpha/beta hydrolase [Gemmatimonadota bacterium]|nr:alpha/beta hydrolase [Gemmatimonadota bacterium]